MKISAGLSMPTFDEGVAGMDGQGHGRLSLASRPQEVNELYDPCPCSLYRNVQSQSHPWHPVQPIPGMTHASCTSKLLVVSACADAACLDNGLMQGPTWMTIEPMWQFVQHWLSTRHQYHLLRAAGVQQALAHS